MTNGKLLRRAEAYVRCRLGLGIREDDVYFHLAVMAYIAGYKGGLRDKRRETDNNNNAL